MVALRTDAVSYQTFTSAGARLSSYQDTQKQIQSECEIRVATTPDGISRLFTIRREELPAAGLTPAQWAFSVTAWNPANFTKLWETRIASAAPGNYPCSDDDPGVRATTDGRWVMVSDIANTHAVLDAQSGAMRKVDFAPFPFGVNIGKIVSSCSGCPGGEPVATVLDPDALGALSTMKDGARETNGPVEQLDYGLDRTSESAWFTNGTVLATASGGEVRILDTIAGTSTMLPIGADHDHPKTVSGTVRTDNTDDFLAVHESWTGDNSTPLRGFDVKTGTQLWKVDNVEYFCKVGDAQINVIANNQMVLLDKRTGQQLEYTDRINRCDYVFGDHSFSTDGTVYKLVD